MFSDLAKIYFDNLHFRPCVPQKSGRGQVLWSLDHLGQKKCVASYSATSKTPVSIPYMTIMIRMEVVETNIDTNCICKSSLADGEVL